MSALAKARVFWRSALQGIRRAPFVHGVAVATLSIALFALGLARGAASTLDHLIGSLGNEVQVLVYLEPALAADRIEGLARRLEARGFGVAIVSPRAALARLVRELGPAGDALRDVPGNPLPPSLELRAPRAERAPEALRRLASELRVLPGVTAVDYGEEAVARLTALARALHWAGWLAFAVLVATTVVIISATLQLAMYARREELEIQKLVGATDRFVQAPFLIEGMLQGALGAVLALTALYAFHRGLGPQLETLFAFLRVPGAGPTLWTPALAVQLVATGVGLGFAGSFAAVARFLRA